MAEIELGFHPLEPGLLSEWEKEASGRRKAKRLLADNPQFAAVRFEGCAIHDKAGNAVAYGHMFFGMTTKAD